MPDFSSSNDIYGRLKQPVFEDKDFLFVWCGVWRALYVLLCAQHGMMIEGKKTRIEEDMDVISSLIMVFLDWKKNTSDNNWIHNCGWFPKRIDCGDSSAQRG